MGVYSEFDILELKIEHLRLTGSSLIMNWGEDPTPIWEVCWITSGQRFCGFHSNLSTALDIAHAEGVAHFAPYAR